jgi:hypothetical protein
VYWLVGQGQTFALLFPQIGLRCRHMLFERLSVRVCLHAVVDINPIMLSLQLLRLPLLCHAWLRGRAVRIRRQI